MRRICRVDSNQQLVVRALRELGCSVQLLHQLGQGCPDAIVGHGGSNYLIEVKDGAKSPSRQKLTPDEAIWHENWRGQIAIVSNVEQAINVIGLS